MHDESFFFVKVATICRRNVVTCQTEAQLADVVLTMRDRNVSGVVVCRGDDPVGMITDRDFRNQLLSLCGNLDRLTAADLMTQPLVTLTETDYVFEALYKMAKHNIHRLVVVDGAGRLRGILTDTDLIALQTTMPLYLNHEIQGAQTLADLKKVNERLGEVVVYASRSGARTRDVVRLISHFNDSVTDRTIALLQKTRGIELPEGAAFLALGSEGRREQTLRTDQDNAVVFRDDLGSEGEQRVEAFSVALVNALAEIGVPRCPGGTMASNPEWRRPLSGWARELDHWVNTPTAGSMVRFGTFQDLRTVHGDPELERTLKEHLVTTVGRNSIFLAQVAKNILNFGVPLGWFGRIKLAPEGEHKGKLDLKKAGIFTLTEGVALLALEAGIVGGGTWEKLDALEERKVASGEGLARVRQAFTFLTYLRLKSQVQAIEAGLAPGNHVGFGEISLVERERLKGALHAVKTFQWELKDRFKLDFIAR